MQTPEEVAGATTSITLREPERLGPRGRRLWNELIEIHAFGPAERVLLEEACRIADRLERLDSVLAGDADSWLSLRERKGNDEALEIVIDSALSEARQQANVLKQIVAALRLPDAKTGERPQHRGPRGAYQPKGAGSGTVSSLDRRRAARGA